jgi:thiol-disulfide isomerase/thioredoxin
MALKLALRAVTVLIVLCFVGLGIAVYRVVDLPSAPDVAAGSGPGGSGTAIGKFTALAAKLPAPAVSFTAKTGRTVHLADYRGRVVLVNLWATWCPPCVKEMPSLLELQARRPDLAILAISEDRRGAAAVDPFVARLGLGRLATFLDPDGKVSEAFHVVGLPTSFLIDRDGRIVGALEGGADWNDPALVAHIDAWLDAPVRSEAGAG